MIKISFNKVNYQNSVIIYHKQIKRSKRILTFFYSSTKKLSFFRLVQRIYISDRRDSTPPLRLPSSKHVSTQPLPALSAVYFNYLTIWQSRRRERLGGQMFGRAGGCCHHPSLTYILCFSLSRLLLFLPMSVSSRIGLISDLARPSTLTSSREPM